MLETEVKELSIQVVRKKKKKRKKTPCNCNTLSLFGQRTFQVGYGRK